MKESIYKDKIKIGKELLRNLVGPVPPKFYDMDNTNWLKSYYDKILKERESKEEGIEHVYQNKISIGIELNASELKVLIAILKILSKHHYISNVNEDSTKFRIGISELIKAYGSDMNKGNARKRVLNNLKSLSSREFVLMFEQEIAGADAEESFTADRGKLLESVRNWTKLFDYEFISIMNRKFIQIKFLSSIFSARIENYYALLPDDFIENIAMMKAAGGKKNSKLSNSELYFNLFILSQLSLRRQKIISIKKQSRPNNNWGSASIIRTNFAKLAFQLRMLNSLEKGFWSSIRQKIREYLKRAEANGYVKRFSEDKDNDSITIELNIEGVFIPKPDEREE